MKTTAGLPIGLQHASVVEQRFKTSMITHHTSTYVRRCLENKSPNTGYRRQQPTSTIGQPASADWGTRRFAPRLCSLGLLSCFDVLYTTASEELGAAACYWLPGGQGAEQSIATKLYTVSQSVVQAWTLIVLWQLTPRARGTSANVCIYVKFLETRIIGLHFAVVFLHIFLVGFLKCFFFCKSAFRPFKIKVMFIDFWYQITNRKRVCDVGSLS